MDKEFYSEQRLKFGKDLDRALLWYKAITGKKKLSEHDYDTCYEQWNLLTALDSITLQSNMEFDDGYIDSTFKTMSMIFNIDVELNEEDIEKKCEFITDCLKRFQLETKADVARKASVRILKMRFEDLDNNGNFWYFDSRLTKKSDNTMSWVLSSEDYISRYLSSIGKDQIVINMNTTDFEKDMTDVVKYQKRKKDIYMNGIIDVSNGNRYLRTVASASGTRLVNIPFIKADSPEEVEKTWCDITNFDNLTDLMANMGKVDENGDIWIIMQKVKARIAQNSANSLNLNKLNKHNFDFSQEKVMFIPDFEGTINSAYKTLTEDGNFVMKFPNGKVLKETVNF